MNEDQIAFWNGDGGTKWTAHQDLLDRTLDRIGLEAIAAAAPAPNERVIDIGCGCGSTSLDLARWVAPAGEVLGVDVSAPMVARARQRGAGLSGLSFAEGDAAVHAFARDHADLVFSRFGVMFFEAPAPAFANILKGLKPGGRLAFVCWRALKENPWVTTGLQVALRHLPAPAPMDPHAPGPFAFADPARVEGILGEAGFTEIEIRPFDTELVLGGDGGPEAAVAFTREIGPVGRLLTEAPAEARPRVEKDLLDLYRGMTDGRGRVRAGAAVWIVTARNP